MIKPMINVYYRLVVSGSRSIEDIPEEYREAVKAKIAPQTENNESESE